MDHNLLCALKDRARFRQLRGAVPDSMLGQETVAMLAWFSKYFESFPDKERIETDVLHSLFTLRAQGSPEQLAVMRALINRLDTPVPQEVLDGITLQLLERDFAGRAAALLNAYEAGEEVDLTYELNRMASESMRRLSASNPSDYIKTDIADILAAFQDERGVKLPTMALQEHVSGLAGGDLVGIAARPDRGKTSFIAKILTHAAPQMEALGKGSRPMLWFNNEGVGTRIIPRIYQSALKVDFTELCRLSNEGLLQERYNKAVNGVEIRVKDCHGFSLGQLEQVMEEMKPSIVVFDMMANFRLPGASAGGNKTDSLEAGWQEAREMMVRHDCIGFGTIQISDIGDDQLYPPYNALKDSRTGIQGALDVQIMLGALNAPDMATLRGISLPKNKRQITGRPSNIHSEVWFDAARCDFTDGNQ